MNIDENTVFSRIVVDETIHGEFKITKGSGPLKDLYFVVGKAVISNEKGVPFEIDAVYPYECVRSFIVSIKEVDEEGKE